MTIDKDEVLAFATFLMGELPKRTGASWARVEIDGFFFNRYLNPKLLSAIELARSNLKEQKTKNVGTEPTISDRETGVSHPYATASALEIGSEYGVRWDYVECAIDHNWPVAFKRSQHHLDYETGVYKVLIYSQLKKEDKFLLKKRYEGFLSHLSSASPIGLLGGANIKSEMSENPRFLQIQSSWPMASSRVFVQVVNEELKAHGSGLLSGGSAETTIREWTVYLLADRCSLSNREAIGLWNEKVADRHAYSMLEESFTSSGEIQFSRDKANLVSRIAHYEEYLLPP